MTTRKKGVFAPCVLLLVLVGFGRAQAAPINYGDVDDIPPGAVMYLDVTESSVTDPGPLFGIPNVNLDDLDFDPMGFGASSTNGISDITDGQLNFGIMTLPGAGLTSLQFSERGDYTLAGTGTGVTQVGAGIAVMIEILAVDGAALIQPLQLFANASISQDLVSGGGQDVPWSLGLLIDLGAALTQNNIDYLEGVSKAKVVLDNTLFAISEQSSIALIVKKDFHVTPGGDLQPDVPEPSALVLAALAAMSLVLRRRRAA
jgi:hypothetical protein